MGNNNKNINNDETNKEKNRKKNKIKKVRLITLSAILAALILFFFLREAGVISKHVHENVENMAEREGVSFDNLLFSYQITFLDHGYHMGRRFFCIFNTGDVYCFEHELWFCWDGYYDGSDGVHEYGYDDDIWETAENVVYMGRLSTYDTNRLNEYISNYDIYGEYYVKTYESVSTTVDVTMPMGPRRFPGDLEYYTVKIYWHDQPEYGGRRDIEIERADITFIDYNNYEKGSPSVKSYEENAMAALELVESTFFYDRFIYICHTLYPL